MTNVAVRAVTQAVAETLPDTPLEALENIRQRAFELSQSRCAFQDWLEAEREVLGWPAAELADKETAFLLRMAVPGFKADEVTVTAAPNFIEVKGEAKQERRSGEKEVVVWSEINSRSLYRRFALANPIDEKMVQAKLADGVLQIHAPKAAARALKPMTMPGVAA